MFLMFAGRLILEFGIRNHKVGRDFCKRGMV